MKSIANLNDALTRLLQSLYDGEKKLQRGLGECVKNVTSEGLKKELAHYEENIGDALLKIERVFNYLLISPEGAPNYIMRRMIKETHDMVDAAGLVALKDIIMISCLQSISQYRISKYQTALAFADYCAPDNVYDLLHEILEQELQLEQSLRKMSLETVQSVRTD
jgi:ferritin-like metal-binding protein YciE